MSESGASGNGEETQKRKENSCPDSVRITVHGQAENETHFKVKKTTKMVRVKKIYAESLGIENYQELRFLLDGERISDDATPEELKIKTDAVIEVFQVQHAG